MIRSVVPGSIAAVASTAGQSLAEAFMGVDIVAIVDTSGSMATHDSRGDQERYRVACDELAQLQAKYPGKVGVIAFSDFAAFMPGGVPEYYGGGTNLTKALEFAAIVDGTVRLVVISDGYPNDPEGALRVAAKMQSEISTIYVGNTDDQLGPAFLAKLAKQKHGQFATATVGDLLSNKVEGLLLAAG